MKWSSDFKFRVDVVQPISLMQTSQSHLKFYIPIHNILTYQLTTVNSVIRDYFLKIILSSYVNYNL